MARVRDLHRRAGKEKERNQTRRTILLFDHFQFNLDFSELLLELFHPRLDILKFRFGNLLVEQAVLDLFLEVVKLGLDGTPLGEEVLVLRERE